MEISECIKALNDIIIWKRANYVDDNKYKYLRLLRSKYNEIPTFLYKILSLKAMDIMKNNIRKFKDNTPDNLIDRDFCCRFTSFTGLPCIHSINNLNEDQLIQLVQKELYISNCL